jgi:hypothetical protein
MKKEKRLTKRERKAAAGGGTSAGGQEQHIHCVACGRHLDDAEFESGAATTVQCAHGTAFPSCKGCIPMTKALLADHDRTGQPVKSAAAWH